MLVKALTAAQDAALEKKIAALSASLAKGALSTDARAIKAETLFVCTVEALDAAHLEVLELFVRARSALDRDTVTRQGQHLGRGVDRVVAVLVGEGSFTRPSSNGRGRGPAR